MLVTCSACHRQVEPCVTSKPPHKPICSECTAEIAGLSSFLVASLVRDKKFLKQDKKGFTFFCTRDQAHHPGVLQKNAAGNYEVVCSKCMTPMNVSQYMLDQMKTLQNLNKKS